MPLRLARLTLLCILPLIAACSAPYQGVGFDLQAFTTVPGSQIEGRLRLPPGSDINGPTFLILTEGARGDTKARSEQFEMALQGNAYETPSGSIGLRYRLQPKDYARYDRARRKLTARMVAEEIAAISVRYRLCRRAGIAVDPPFVVGFLLLSEKGAPIYLAEAPLPAATAQDELPYCI